jgi:BirA family biotin operon repressor/biotin-[acetyl-CoA-carboxylase] ligase
MAFALGQKARAAGYRLATYEAIGSTSNEAFAWARLGDPGRLWVVARAQTQGHGRRGRPWQTPEGNLAASLLMYESDLGSIAATLGFVAGLALESAIHAVGQNVAVQLKWPNDVLCRDGAKVAGILLEAVPMVGVPSCVVIGIGVNISVAPTGVPYPATTLAACGIRTTPGALFEALAEAWVDCVALWSGGRGFATVRERWLERAVGVGAPISVKLGEETVSGTFETIDGEGRLIIRSGDGSRLPISAGDVMFGAAATAGVHS